MATRLDRLRNHVDALEAQMAGAEGSAYASLSGRYMDALKQIEDLEAADVASTAKEATALDEFSRRLAARKSGTAGRGGASG